VVIEESVATLPGTDGRKMSKSYDNTIPLFARARSSKKLIAGIVTDSRAPGEPKEVEGSALFQIYQAFASRRRNRRPAQGLRRRHRLGRRQAVVFERLDREITPMREAYDALMRDPAPSRHPARRRCQGAQAGDALHGALRHAVGLRTTYRWR
jgi:tryptophanyl-tRNA synthetase